MKTYAWAIIMALGIAIGGYFIYSGICNFAEKDRCVTVKGLSEREVLANRVTWPMSVALEGNNLEGVCNEIARKQKAIVKFLTDNKIKEDDIFVNNPNISDRWEYGYEDAIKNNKARYKVTADVTVTSRDVPHIMKLMQNQEALLKQGVCVSTEDYRVQYDYVDLTNIKPEMVEEATKDARKVAEKFAEDADCKLGSIMSATQGQFTIESQYYRPQYKQIRVVTTISYYLK